MAFADLRVVAHVRALGPRGSEEEARRRAASLRRECPLPGALEQAVTDLLTRVLTPALRGGWGPAELAEAVDRMIGSSHRAVVSGLVLAARHVGGGHTAAWEAEISALGQPRQLALGDDGDLSLALRLIALVAALPAAEVPVQRRASEQAPIGSRASAKLAQVRALLAKAEATTFPEEGEALSAKAQELISTYSLEQLLHLGDEHGDDRSTTTYRRVWLDAPYLDAKATLVDEVAGANRCRAVYDTRLGVCTVVGSAFDLDAAELMITSLLAQAQRAMLAHGSRADLAGRSRTRSFRQSFLLSFAVHIGQRLRRVTEESVTAAAAPALLPAIRDHEVEVDELTAMMFPNLVEKSTAITNQEGWAGGRAAAELAQLNLFDEVQT
ncbi:DUF2786 domain-containing protein [Kribbella caucasensis]|uniref:DUF2786 domain-containing protein n=1 Tax=Kribbella caucasensis TaxID=2512215 RepID=UPI00105F272C|nr:DUF2786 domain-containing protein [Kribbella sp. VKM Ac-2527]